jgi:hypothetical protein
MFGGMFSSFDKNKTKAQLKLGACMPPVRAVCCARAPIRGLVAYSFALDAGAAINRLNLLRHKKRNSVDVFERQIKDLLQAGKIEQAKIKAEHVIRENDEGDA